MKLGRPSVVHGSVAGLVLHPAGYESEIPLMDDVNDPVSGGADGDTVGDGAGVGVGASEAS